MSGRKLRPEEKALWDDVARSATPLEKRAQASVPHPAPKRPKAPAAPAAPPPRSIAPFEITGRRAPADVHVHATPSVTDSLRAAPVNMDFKTYKRMSKGKLAPEARIDLHGMTTARAQPALTGFIRSSYDRGLRLVLVITGKGRQSEEWGPMPQRLGILRHEVPMWLQRPPLGGLVQQVTPANARHGGHGAYYVYLRRR
jgi:DNA-nicking Smr family endonuclease